MTRHDLRRRIHSPDSGFGLLELLVAISILTAILLAFAQAFRLNVNRLDSAKARLDTNHLARSVEARLTSRTLAGIKNDLSAFPQLKFDARPLEGNYTGRWRPYVLTIYRLSDKGPDFVYEAIKLIRP